MIELAVILLIPIVLIVGGTAWFLARRSRSWGRLAIILLAPLPLPILILVGGIGSIAYGWDLPGNECSLNACGGYVIMGVLGIALAIGAFVVGVPAAIIGVALARRGKEDLGRSFE